MIETKSTETKSKQITFILKDNRVIEIIEKIPDDMINDTLEKYIIAGHMVINYCSIAESKETIENILNPIRQDILIPFKTEVETIRQQLRIVIPTISKSSIKGDITVKSIFGDLKQHFMDDSFEDVSALKNYYSDIKATANNNIGNVIIETKDYTEDVPSTQVDKFWRDMETRDFKYGIFISMRSNISKISGPIKIETKNGKTAIFLINRELNWRGHIISYYIIKKIMEFEATVKEESKGDDTIKIIKTINIISMDIKRDIETMDKLIDIIEKLKTSNNNRLDEIRNTINSYKRNIETKILEILKEIEKIEVN